MADNVEVQGIEFEIIGETKEAIEGLDDLSATLNRIRQATKGGLGLNAIAHEIKNFNSTLNGANFKGLGDIKEIMSALAQKLQETKSKIQSAFNASLANVFSTKHVNNATRENSQSAGDEATTERVDGTLRVIRLMKKAFDNADNSAANFFKNVKAKLVMAMSKTKLLKAEIAALKRDLQDGIASGKWDDKRIASTALSIQKLKAQLKGITPLWRKLVGSGAKGVGNAFTAPFKNLGNMFKKAGASLKGFLSSLKRIAMYRAVRAVISALTQGLKEGIGYLNLYSKSAGTQFHKSLNTLATDALYLKASLATAVAPIVDALAPALDFLSDKIANVLNLLAQLFAKLSGKSVYTKAVKTQTEYSDSISKAASKTKDFLADFDELNVFDPNKGGSGSDLPDFKSMFEEAEVDDDLGNFVDRIKEAINEGDWIGVGTTIGQKLGELVDKWNAYDWGVKLGEKINAGLGVAYGFLTSFPFETFGRKIADFFNGMLDTVDWNLLGRTLAAGFNGVFDFLYGFITQFNWSKFGAAVALQTERKFFADKAQK